MKKWVITTILSLSAIFLMIGNVNASSPDINSVDLSNINSLTGHTSYYAISYSIIHNTWDLVFFNQNTGYLAIDNGTNFINDICTEQGACFSRIWATKSGTSSPRYSAWYHSTDNGVTWTLKASNAYNTEPITKGYIVKSTVYLKDRATGNTTYFNPDYELSLNSFNITYEQGEVLMSQYENSTANLVTQYIETDLTTYDYIFSYSTNTGGGGGFRDSKEYEPICTENLVDDTIHYSCYYNIPLFYNTTLTFYITDKNTNEVVYQEDYTAYLSSLPNTDYYTIYELNNYKYVNISNIDSGTFGVTDSISEDIAIYVTDKNTGNNIDFITSEYYVSTLIENGVKYREFNFNGNTNLYLTLEIKNNELWNNSTEKYYLFSPSSAYTHLSGMANLEENQDNPVNQQAYKDDNGTIHYINNPISYDDYDNNFYSQSNNVINGTLNFIKGTTTILTTFITSLDTPIQYTIYACFSFLLIAIVIMLFKH